MIAAVLAAGELHDFFDSKAWLLTRNLGLFFLAVFWFATAFWVYKDARRRIEDRWFVRTATALGLWRRAPWTAGGRPREPGSLGGHECASAHGHDSPAGPAG